MNQDDIKIQLTRIEERQMALSSKVEELDEKLFGNGQPGIISTLTTRLSSLERKYWLFLGGGVTAIWLMDKLIDVWKSVGG